MKKTLYHILALLVVAIWGVTFVCTKVLLGAGFNQAQIFALRFLVAYVGIWALCLREVPTRRLFSEGFRDEIVFVILGVSGGSLYFYTENSALIYTQACNVSFIVCSAPLLTALLTLLVKKLFHGELASGLETVHRRGALAAGTILALGGMAAVTFDGQALNFSARGDLLALGAAVCWAVYSIYMNWMTGKYGTLFATRKVFFWGLVTILPFVKPFDFSGFGRIEVWGNFAFLALAASFGGYVLWNKVMKELGNVTATNYIYLNPIFTLLAAVYFLGESLSSQSAAGCAAILAGVVLASGLRLPQKARPKE